VQFKFVPRMRKSLIGLFVCMAVAVSGVSLAACGGGGSDGKGAVAMSFGSLEPALWNDILVYMKTELEEQDYELLVDDPQFKVEKQVSDWEAWLAQGDVKSIMGYPVQADALVPVTAQANGAGVPVLGYTQNWEGTAAALVTNPLEDGEMLGTNAGEWIVENYGDKPVDVAILSDYKAELTKERSEGMIAAVEETAPNAVIHDLPSFSRSEGFDAAESLLTSNPDTKVWIAFGSENVLGAYRAVINSGVSKTDPDYFFGALDSTNEILDIMAIPDSIWRVGYVFPSKELAEINTRLLVGAAEGEEVKDELIVPKLVTKDNIDSFYFDEEKAIEGAETIKKESEEEEAAAEK
jgi:ribose transport system substrate-binding protein